MLVTVMVEEKKNKIENHDQNTERDSGKLRHSEGVLPLKHRGRQQ